MGHLDAMIDANAWANRTLTDALTDTDTECLRIFSHSLAGELNWSGRIRTGKDVVGFWPVYARSELDAVIDSCVASWRGALAVIGGDPEAVHDYVDTRGTAYRVPFSAMVMQGITHAWFHRGEIYRLLDLDGRRPVDTDHIIHHHRSAKG